MTPSTETLLVRRDEYVPKSDGEQFIVPLLREKIESALNTYAASPAANARALDVGCGEQPLRNSLGAMGYVYVSIDIEQNAKNSVDYVCPIDKVLPLDLAEQKPFDFIVCTEVLEHVADWNTAFDNLTRLTAPGGYLFLTCPSFWPMHEVPHDFWRPTIFALKYYAEKYGMEVVQLEGAGDGWNVLGTLISAYYFIPADRRFWSRVCSRLVRIGRNQLFRWLSSGKLQSRVQLLDGVNSRMAPFYMCNIAVLRKPLLDANHIGSA